MMFKKMRNSDGSLKDNSSLVHAEWKKFEKKHGMKIKSGSNAWGWDQ